MDLQVVAMSVSLRGTVASMPPKLLLYVVTNVVMGIPKLSTKHQVIIGGTPLCSVAAVPPAMLGAIVG